MAICCRRPRHTPTHAARKWNVTGPVVLFARVVVRATGHSAIGVLDSILKARERRAEPGASADDYAFSCDVVRAQVQGPVRGGFGVDRRADDSACPELVSPRGAMLPGSRPARQRRAADLNGVPVRISDVSASAPTCAAQL